MRHFRSSILQLLIVTLMVSLTGCQESQEQAEYREFNSLSEDQEDDPQPKKTGDSPSADDAIDNSKPPSSADAESKSNAVAGAPDEKPWQPLVAVKPVYAESLADVKSNIENKPASPEETRDVKLLIPENTFKTEGPENALRISYDDFDLLKILNMEPVPPDAPDHFPSWLKDLDGKRVRVRGFMYPPFRETGLEQFILARDNQICCFGRNPKIYDLVNVVMRDGVTANYIQNRPFDVVGVFRIRPDQEDGEWYGLYELTDAIVID